MHRLSRVIKLIDQSWVLTVKGKILEESVYDHSVVIIPLDSKGSLTVRVEGKLIQLVEATREIIEIVDLLNQ